MLQTTHLAWTWSMNLTQEQASVLLGVAERCGFEVELRSDLYSVPPASDDEEPTYIQGYLATVSVTDDGRLQRTVQSLNKFVNAAAESGMNLLAS